MDAFFEVASLDRGFLYVGIKPADLGNVMSGVCGLTRVQDVRQDGDDTQLTVAAGLLHHVFVDNLNGEFARDGSV